MSKTKQHPITYEHIGWMLFRLAIFFVVGSAIWAWANWIGAITEEEMSLEGKASLRHINIPPSCWVITNTSFDPNLKFLACGHRDQDGDITDAIYLSEEEVKAMFEDVHWD